MRRRRGAPGSVASVVRRVLAKLSRQRPSPLAKAQAEWPDVVGKRLALHSRPTALRKGVLTVKVDQSGWLYQLNIERNRILEALNERLGQGVVRAIHGRIGEVECISTSGTG